MGSSEASMLNVGGSGGPVGRLARIVIADDHEVARVGLRSILTDEQDLRVIGEARNGREALALCRRLRPDLVLLDVRMPDMDGLAVTAPCDRNRRGRASSCSRCMRVWTT